MVEPVPTENSGIYVTQVVSDVFVRTCQSFCRLSNAHRSSLDEGQGVPEEKREVQTMMTSRLLGDRDKCEGRGPCYCMIEMINTGASTVEMGKNVNVGKGEPLELCEDKVVLEEDRADHG
jgi:hypothetical protein